MYEGTVNPFTDYISRLGEEFLIVKVFFTTYLYFSEFASHQDLCIVTLTIPTAEFVNMHTVLISQNDSSTELC